MLKWLWQRLGLAGRDASDFDAVYGLPKSAVDEWLQWNPQLEAEHKALERLAETRRRAHRGERHFPKT